MDDARAPPEGPPLSDIESVFDVVEVRRDGDKLVYLGWPRVGTDRLERELWPLFRETGYEVTLEVDDDGRSFGRYALVARPRSTGIDGIPWTNVALLVATIASTLFVGSQWYYVTLDDPLDVLGGWPFAATVLGILAVHESGHYVLSRYHGVEASLPYFLPFPSLIGTAGAVIRMRGRMPDRKALFDIGAAGPLAGLVATVVVTVIGLHLDPIRVPEAVLNSENTATIQIHYPLLMQLLAVATGQPLEYAPPLAANPVVFSGWVGMFVTFLNLLPVGQFDGGHIVRAMLGQRQETVAAAVPAALFALAGYIYVAGEALNASVLWGFWGVLTMGMAYAGPAEPIYDEPLDGKRKALGALTLVLGLLCFTPVPIEIHTAV